MPEFASLKAIGCQHLHCLAISFFSPWEQQIKAAMNLSHNQLQFGSYNTAVWNDMKRYKMLWDWHGMAVHLLTDFCCLFSEKRDIFFRFWWDFDTFGVLNNDQFTCCGGGAYMTVSNRLGDSVGGELVQVFIQGPTGLTWIPKASHGLKGDTVHVPNISKPSFLVSMLDFGGVRVLMILCCRTLPNLVRRKTTLISLNITW